MMFTISITPPICSLFPSSHASCSSPIAQWISSLGTWCMSMALAISAESRYPEISPLASNYTTHHDSARQQAFSTQLIKCTKSSLFKRMVTNLLKDGLTTKTLIFIWSISKKWASGGSREVCARRRQTFISCKRSGRAPSSTQRSQLTSKQAKRSSFLWFFVTMLVWIEIITSSWLRNLRVTALLFLCRTSSTERVPTLKWVKRTRKSPTCETSIVSTPAHCLWTIWAIRRRSKKQEQNGTKSNSEGCLSLRHWLLTFSAQALPKPSSNLATLL